MKMKITLSLIIALLIGVILYLFTFSSEICEKRLNIQIQSQTEASLSNKSLLLEYIEDGNIESVITLLKLDVKSDFMTLDALGISIKNQSERVQELWQKMSNDD